MRIARFAAGGDPQFGVVELAEDGGRYPDTVSVLTGDPMAMPVQLTGERRELGRRTPAGAGDPAQQDRRCRSQLRRARGRAGQRGTDDAADLLQAEHVGDRAGRADHLPGGQPARCSFEGELAVVIGRICKEVPVERVAEVIFGYTVANDVTARDLQKSDGQWARAKGYDTFCPLGPWITTHQSLDEVGDLRIRTTLDGEERQDGNTSDMIFSVPELVVYISSYTTLLPGRRDLDRYARPASARCCRARRSASRSRASARSPTRWSARHRMRQRDEPEQ